jgi:hypothetical protein
MMPAIGTVLGAHRTLGLGVLYAITIVGILAAVAKLS